jgi:lipopolysaccharide/colanic/teichoic acid biosynthesis glycosyltransferase
LRSAPFAAQIPISNTNFSEEKGVFDGRIDYRILGLYERTKEILASAHYSLPSPNGRARLPEFGLRGGSFYLHTLLSAIVPFMVRLIWTFSGGLTERRLYDDGAMVKRAFDSLIALAGLLCLSPLFLVVAVLVKLDSPGPVFFKQERMGRGFRRFFIYKFRTMIQDAPLQGGPITFGRDPRITCVGRLLRKAKIDELPQLINVLRGEMSFVGPRPEVPRYVELFRSDYQEILQIRPGITDLASLKYRDEASLLGQSGNPEEEYLRRVLPDKIKLAKDYLRGASFCSDLSLILKTLLRLFGGRES